MTVPAFRLEEAGFTRDQVEALAEFMGGSMATKADIERLEGKIIGLEGKMNADVERLEGKMNADNQRLEGKINLVYWMLGVILLVEVIPYLKAFFGGG